MSSVRLLLSGSLVASGLILGAFTLHDVFNPSSTQKRSQTAGRQEQQSGPKGVNAFQTKTRFESGAQDGRSKAPLVKASTRHDAKPADKSADALSDEAKAARAEARRKRGEKRRAEKDKTEREKLAKAKQEPPPQQATLQWPWNYWFGN